MSDDGPRIWIDHYDLNVGVVGGDQDTLDEVEEVFEKQLRKAIERDPKIGEDVDPPGVQ